MCKLVKLSMASLSLLFSNSVLADPTTATAKADVLKPDSAVSGPANGDANVAVKTIHYINVQNAQANSTYSFTATIQSGIYGATPGTNYEATGQTLITVTDEAGNGAGLNLTINCNPIKIGRAHV